MSERGQLELFHSVLACAYEERQPLRLRLMDTIKKHIVPRRTFLPVNIPWVRNGLRREPVHNVSVQNVIATNI